MKKLRSIGKVLLATSALLALSASFAAPSHADKKSNILVAGLTNDVVTLDPATGFSGNDYSVLYSIYDRLIHFNPKTMEPIPGLATEWSFKGPDKREFEMVLRQGVTFQDGTPFDAEAVKASLMHFKDVKRLNDLDVVTGIEVVAPDRVVLKLAHEYSVLPMVLADRAGMIVSPTALAKYGEDFARNPVGTGPFQLRDWTHGREIELERYPGYWNADRIKLDGITYKIFLNPTSAVSAIVSGQVDHVWFVPPQNLPIIKASPRLRVEKQPSTRYHYMALRHDTPLIANKQVRQAISRAIDRQALGDAVYGPGNHGGPALMMANPDNYAYSPDLAGSVTYDPAAAKKLLAEAGYPDGITLKVCGGTETGTGTDITDVETEQMKAAGIKLDVTIMSGSACLQRFNTTKDFHIWQGSFSGRPDPFITYSQTFMSTGQFNRGKRDFGADELIGKLATVYTREEQKPIYHEINERWIDEVGAVQIVYVSNFAVYNTDLAGEEPNEQGKPDLTSMYYK